MDEDGALQKSRRRFLAVTVVITVGIVGLFGLGAYQIIERRQDAAREREILCEAENRGRDALRQVLVLAQTLPSDDVTAAERRRSDQFFERAYRLIRPINCDLFGESPNAEARFP